MRSLSTLVVAILVGAFFTGCLSDEEPVETESATQAAADQKAIEDAVANNTSPDASEKNATLGSMPHLHDYWKGKERVTLIDEDYELDAPNAAFWTVFSTFLVHEPIAGGTFVELPDGQLVFEGTGQLDITVSWNDPAVTGMRVAFKDAGSGAIGDWLPLPKGVLTSIPITPDMTDMPHTKHSRWFFIFGAAGTPAIAVGKVHITIEIVKMRDIEKFPGHPDFWQGAPTLELVKASGVAKSQAGPQTQAKQLTDPLSTPEDIITGGKVVPMETLILIGNVTIKSVNPELKVDHIHLFYRAASDFSNEFNELEKGAKSEDGLTWTWEWPVEMDQTDNPYSEKSEWAFRVTVGYVNPVPGLPPCDDGCYNAEMSYDLLVTAVKGGHDMAGM